MKINYSLAYCHKQQMTVSKIAVTQQLARKYNANKFKGGLRE